MQQTSDAYKTAMALDNRNHSYVQIVLAIVDSTVNADASLSDSGHAPFSNVAGAVGILTPSKLYATMECNRLPVDGSKTVVPDDGDYAAQGYCSDVLSGADCTFTANPIISASFGTTHNILGFTIAFDDPENLYCTDFTVRIYDGTTLLNTFPVTGNTDTQYMIDTPFVGFNRIEVEFVKTSKPSNRVHVFGFAFGLVKTFTNDDLVDDGMTQDTAIDPVSSTLPVSELDFSIDNYSGYYNPDNPVGVYACLQEEQPVSLSYGYDVDGNGIIEWIPGGRYYLIDWSAPANKQSASFTAQSLLEFMQQTYTKGVYAPNGAALYDLATAVLVDANLPKAADGSDPWILDESLKNIHTTAPLPAQAQRELLQLIANAGMCVLSVSRDGKICIAPADDTPQDYYLNLGVAMEYPENTLTSPLAEVDVKVYSFLPDTAASNISSTVVAVSGTQVVHIDYSDNPSTGVAATVTGGTLVSATYYSYSCDLTITSNGSVTIALAGCKLNSSNSVAAYQTGGTGEVCPVDNPIITDPANAAAVAKWTADYLSLRRTYTEDYRGEPALDAGDVITMQTQYTDSLPAKVLENVVKFDTALSGTITLKGMSQ